MPRGVRPAWRRRPQHHHPSLGGATLGTRARRLAFGEPTLTPPAAGATIFPHIGSVPGWECARARLALALGAPMPPGGDIGRGGRRRRRVRHVWRDGGGFWRNAKNTLGLKYL